MRGLGPQIAPIVIGKLLAHPLAVFLAVTVLSVLGMGEMEPALRMAVVLTAAMPMMGIYPTLAQAYGLEDSSAVAMLVTTATSFFTISGMLWAFRHLPV